MLSLALHHGIRDAAHLRRLARGAERAGYHRLWVTERYFAEETFSLLGACAAVTQKIGLGVGVVNPYTRHPALLAMAAATLARLSRGRFVLGLGRSERGLIEGKLHLRHRPALPRLEETVQLLRRLWQGPVHRFRGHHFQLDDSELHSPAAAHALPIYVAAIGPRTLALAGRIADGVLLNTYSTPRYVRWAVRHVCESARRSGRARDAVQIACMLAVRSGHQDAADWQRLRERIARLLVADPSGKLLIQVSGFTGPRRRMLEDARRQRSVPAAMRVLDEAAVRPFYLLLDDDSGEQLRAYADAGVDELILLPPLTDFERVARRLAARRHRSVL